MLHLGCARAGALLVNVDPAYRTNEVAFTLRKSRMKALFLWERDSRADYAQILAEARQGRRSAPAHSIFRDAGVERVSASTMRRLRRNYPKTSPTSVHIGNHRHTQGRDVDPPQPGQQRQDAGARHALHRAGSYLCSATDVPLLWMRDWHHVGTGKRSCDHSAQLDIRFARHSRGGTGGTRDPLYGVPAMFIAELGLPEFKNFDLPACAPG